MCKPGLKYNAQTRHRACPPPGGTNVISSRCLALWQMTRILSPPQPVYDAQRGVRVGATTVTQPTEPRPWLEACTNSSAMTEKQVSLHGLNAQRTGALTCDDAQGSASRSHGKEEAYLYDTYTPTCSTPSLTFVWQ